MTNPTRVPGRYGRRAPSNRPAIRFGAIRRAAAVIPPHPASEDYLAALADWQMLGNDRAGNCVAVTWANFRRLVTKFLSTENYPTQDQVWAIYRTQNPDFDPNGTADTNGPGSSADGGMDIQTLLELLVKRGEAVAFAKVDPTNADEVDAALAIFGGLWTGVVVTAANEQEFSAGQPWDYVPGSPQEGGHSVLSGGYTPAVRFITWAAETGFTAAFVTHQVEELWVVVWPEHLGATEFEEGVDVAALEAAFEELTGSKPNWPTTPPAPGPVPSGDVHMDSADLVLAAALGPWLRERHIGGNERAVRAVDAWLDAKQAAH